MHSAISSCFPKFYSCLGLDDSFKSISFTIVPSRAAQPTSFRSLSGSQTVVVCSAGVKKRKRYRKSYPGETKGIAEEMRFVAMKLRNEGEKEDEKKQQAEDEAEGLSGSGETWEPTIEGYLKYLVDSKLVFDTLDKIVDEATHVAYADFRNTGLERTKALSRDIDWFRQQGHLVPINFCYRATQIYLISTFDYSKNTGLERTKALSRDIDWFRQQGHLIPEPSSPGVSYAKYLHEISETSPPGFLCHFYNIYFTHFSGGQMIGKQVAKKILDSRDMDIYRWEGDVAELLKDLREKLNKLGEHWSRDEKNKCLRETSKSFKLSGQIVRLIVL